MTTPATFTTFDFTRSSSRNSFISSYLFTLKQSSALPAGSLLEITLPTPIAILNNVSCTDSVGANLVCVPSTAQKIVVTLPSIASAQQFQVNISSIRNAPSYRPTAVSFSALTLTSDRVSTFASGSISTPLANSAPSSLDYLTYTFTPGSYNDPQTISLTLTPSQFILATSMTLSLPSSFSIQSLVCSGFLGWSATCAVPSGTPNMINITGNLGFSSIQLSVTGFTAPSTTTTDSTILSTYESGFLVDQSISIVFGLICVMPCRTCLSTSNTSCQSCYTNISITTFIYYLSTNSSCLQSCPSNTFSSNFICQPCPTTCLTCTSSSSCSSCNLTSQYPALQINSTVGNCLTACLSSFYLNLTASPPQCLPCVTPCLTCINSTACLTCISSRYLSSNQCLSNCSSNTTVPDNVSWTCTACSSQCSTCSISINNCTSCSPTAAYYN